MEKSLKNVFIQLASGFSHNDVLISNNWIYIESSYSAADRFYHNLSHLQHMYAALLGARQLIDEWNTVLFSMFYHDVVYDPARQDNELQSAALAGKMMNAMQIPGVMIEQVKQQILATTHKDRNAGDKDTHYFVDADLCILGASRELYRQYAGQVRREYAIYPDAIYTAGRKAVLESFLRKEKIFMTKHFYDQYEAAARINIQEELNGTLQAS